MIRGEMRSKVLFPQLACIVWEFCFNFIASPIQVVKMEAFPVTWEKLFWFWYVCQRWQMVKLWVGEGKQEDSGMHWTGFYEQSESRVLFKNFWNNFFYKQKFKYCIGMFFPNNSWAVASSATDV